MGESVKRTLGQQNSVGIHVLQLARWMPMKMSKLVAMGCLWGGFCRATQNPPEEVLGEANLEDEPS